MPEHLLDHGVTSAGFPFDHPAWQLIHAYYLNAVAEQRSKKIRKALAREVGDSFEGFVRACADQLIIISAIWRPDGLNYCVALRVSAGVAPIATVHASLLGLDTPDNEADELARAMRRDPSDPPS